MFIEDTADYALVEFVQRYQSATYSDRVLKQLYMKKQIITGVYCQRELLKRFKFIYYYEISGLVNFALFFCRVIGGRSSSRKRLLDAVDLIQASQFDKAEQQLNTLLVERPDFKLAQLVYADVLMAKTGALPGVGTGIAENEQKALLIREIKTAIPRQMTNLSSINTPPYWPALTQTTVIRLWWI